MEVFVVVNTTNGGTIAAVFSTLELAASYCTQYSYNDYVVHEHIVDLYKEAT